MRKTVVIALMLLMACSARPVDSDCDSMCQPAGPLFPGVGECKEGVCTPTFSDCADQDHISTCAEACEAQGMTCAANACGGITYRLYYDISLCVDPELDGLLFEHECDEPIEWQFNSTVKCCCEQE